MTGNPRFANSKALLWLVNLALLPGIVVMLVIFGIHYLWQILWAVALAITTECLCLKLRGQPLPLSLDGSAVLTALLIAIALPPNTALWVLSVAVISAVALAKQLFGGLGHNLFNPAMVGYSVVLVSFPADLASYPVTAIDAVSGATPLDSVSHRQGLTFSEVLQREQFGRLGGLPWQWVNLAFAIGGVLLLVLRLVRWRICAGVLLGLGSAAALTYDGGSSLSAGSPLFHWFTGATMLTVFFVATDPVTHPRSDAGQWLFGLTVGLLIFVIRAYGSYPDGAAFAILLANAASPAIDQYIYRRSAAQA